jgi:hypothetical protein
MRLTIIETGGRQCVFSLPCSMSLLCLAILPGILLSQVAPIPASSEQTKAAQEYSAMLAQLSKGDWTVDFRAFRIAGALASGPEPSVREGTEHAEFKKLLDSSDNHGALNAANRALDRNYANAQAHLDAITACKLLGRQEEAAIHQRTLDWLLDSIEQDGNGKGPETAYFTVTTQEEYIFLGERLGLASMSHQSLVRTNGHAYDRLQVVDLGTHEVKYLWFNTDVDLGIYHSDGEKTVAAAEESSIPVGVANAKPLAAPDRIVRQYSLSDGDLASKQMNIVVTRTDSGEKVQFQVDFTAPSENPYSDVKANSPGTFEYVFVYWGQRINSDGSPSPLQSAADMHHIIFTGDWKSGDLVHVRFDVPKRFAESAQDWKVWFLIGQGSDMIPSQNLLKGSPVQ